MLFNRLCFRGVNGKFDFVAEGITMDVIFEGLSFFREDQFLVNFKCVNRLFGFIFVQGSSEYEGRSTISNFSCSQVDFSGCLSVQVVVGLVEFFDTCVQDFDLASLGPVFAR